ncbi:hypothetical protein ABGB18_08360 [Nonomuraea sp. B12E4]|uniref:hypothetical protein n=1 Tax=Nonomuraea sp. B12E4 TaxID=3153564 RepID=UPI00325E4670
MLRVRRIAGAAWRSTVPPVVAVACLLMTGACSVGGGTPAGTPAESADLPPPVTAGEARVLWDAEQSLLRDCMARHGFKYWVAPHDPIPEDRDFPYVVDDLGWARRHGYGSDIREHVSRLRDEDPNRLYFEGLPAQRRKAAFVALNGEGPRPGTVKRRPDQLEVRLPTGGRVRRSAVSCTSQAQRQLYGEVWRLWHAISTSSTRVSSPCATGAKCGPSDACSAPHSLVHSPSPPPDGTPGHHPRVARPRPLPTTTTRERSIHEENRRVTGRPGHHGPDRGRRTGGAFATPTPAPDPSSTASPDPSSTPTPAAGGAPRTPVAPGKAAAKGAQMEDGNVYVWGDLDFTGLWCYWSGDHRHWRYAWADPYGSPGTCLTKDHSFNDVATSMWNNGFPGSYGNVKFFKDSGLEGPEMCLAPGEDWGNLGLGWELFNDGTNANDQISSHMWVTNC